MKIDKRVERIFAHAVALDQSGRLRSTICVSPKGVMIINSDDTVLLWFGLRPSESTFKEELVFRANDYDSNHVEERDGAIQFITRDSGFEKRKSCRVPDVDVAAIQKQFDGFWETQKDAVGVVRLASEVCSLLDSALSHIEFTSEEGALVIRQRNIYDGSLLEIKREAARGLGVNASPDRIKHPFGPIAIRTNDFLALFAFSKDLEFSFFAGDAGRDFILVESKDPKMELEATVAGCVYDNLGTITASKKEESHGRQEPEKRRSEPEADRGSERGVSSRRRRCRR